MVMKREVQCAMLASLLGTSLAISLRGHQCEGGMTFTEFVEAFGRSYKAGSTEWAHRESLFQTRVDAIASHNCDQQGLWEAGVNHLTDWTDAERKKLLGHKRSPYGHSGGGLDGVMMFVEKDMPAEFSWNNLTSIKEPSPDQGNCGSCWALAAARSMAARAEIKGLKRDFSADQLVACTLNPHKCGGEGGCEGATAELAYEYVLRRGVVASNDEFKRSGGRAMPYKCPASLTVPSEITTAARIDAAGNEVHMLPENADDSLRGRSLGMVGWTKLPENKEAPLLNALVEGGPVYVAVAAGDGWFSYSGGVLQPMGCDRNNVINHAVVLFGYGIKPKTRIGDVKYWHIKNSWGPRWGESGNIRLQRLDNEEGHCGWDTDPHQGTGCEGGPKKVWVCGSCGLLYDGVIPHFAA